MVIEDLASVTYEWSNAPESEPEPAQPDCPELEPAHPESLLPDAEAARPPVKITTRPASPRDGALLLDLYIARYADELDWNVSHQRSILIMRAQAEEGRLAKQYPNLDRLTIYADDVPAGRMVVDCNETVFRLLDISLLPRFRRQGIASRLLAEMLGEARAARLRIRLEVPKSGSALRLFERLGFGHPLDLGSTLRLTWAPPPLEDDESEPLPSREAHRGEPAADDLLSVDYPLNGTAGLVAVSD